MAGFHPFDDHWEGVGTPKAHERAGLAADFPFCPFTGLVIDDVIREPGKPPRSSFGQAYVEAMLSFSVMAPVAQAAQQDATGYSTPGLRFSNGVRGILAGIDSASNGRPPPARF